MSCVTDSGCEQTNLYDSCGKMAHLRLAFLSNLKVSDIFFCSVDFFNVLNLTYFSELHK